VSDLSLSSSEPSSLSSHFLSPVQLRRGSDRAVWWAPGIYPGQTKTSTKTLHHIQEMVLGEGEILVLGFVYISCLKYCSDLKWQSYDIT